MKNRAINHLILPLILPFTIIACSKPSLTEDLTQGQFTTDSLHFGQEAESLNAMNLRSVKLVITDIQAQKQSTCQGTVFKQGFIITSAHCKLGSNLKGIEISFTNPNNINQPLIVNDQVTDFILHPQYLQNKIEIERDPYNKNLHKSSFDVAVIKYNSSVTRHFTHLNSPLRLPSQENSFLGKTAGFQFYVYSSYHLPEFNQDFTKYQLKYVTQVAQSRNHYSHSIYYFESFGVFSLADEAERFAICNGDSGAGLWLAENKSDSNPTLFGILASSDNQFKIKASPECSSLSYVTSIERDIILNWLKLVL